MTGYPLKTPRKCVRLSHAPLACHVVVRVTAGRSAELVRRPDQPRRATYVELFFDVVYVIALTRLSLLLFSHLSWTTLWRTLVLFGALCWMWILTTWLSGRLNPDQPLVQTLIGGIMLANLLMSVSIPTAFGDQGILFAACYVASQLGRSIFLIVALRQHAVPSGGWALLWFGVSSTLWITGGLLPPEHRLVVWSVAVMVDFVNAQFELPPYEQRGAGLRGSAEHLAERFHKFVIIAIGDKMLSPALKLATYPFELLRVLALAFSFWTAVLMWRIYFYRVGELLPLSITSSKEVGRHSKYLAYAHMVLVAGTWITASSEDAIVSHPTSTGHWARVGLILGGPALFLLGRMMMDRLTFGRFARSRIAGLIVLAACLPITIHFPLMLVTVTMNLVLLAIAVWDAISWKRHPARLQPPVH